MSKNLCFYLLIASLVPILLADSRYQEIINYPQNYTYHYGDNPCWKNLNFNDSTWEKTSLDFFPSEKWEGIGWFRMSVSVDTLLIRKPLGFSCEIVGALDVYIDGRYRFSFGKVGSSIEDEEPLFTKSYLPPEVFVFSGTESSRSDKSKLDAGCSILDTRYLSIEYHPVRNCGFAEAERDHCSCGGKESY